MCKYCGNLWTGDLSETMNEIIVPINVGDYHVDDILIDTQIFEIDKCHPYDKSKGAALHLQFTFRNGNAEVVTNDFPINFCPVCGADLMKI